MGWCLGCTPAATASHTPLKELAYFLASWQPSFPRQLWSTARGRNMLKIWPRLPPATLLFSPEAHWDRAQVWTELCSFSACSRGTPSPQAPHSLSYGGISRAHLGHWRTCRSNWSWWALPFCPAGQRCSSTALLRGSGSALCAIPLSQDAGDR